MRFSLEIPKEWDNAWALKKTDVSWIFTVYDQNSAADDDNGLKENASGSSSGVNSQAAVKNTESKQKTSVKTGDNMPVEIMLLLLLGAGISIPVIRKWKGANKS